MKRFTETHQKTLLQLSAFAVGFVLTALFLSTSLYASTDPQVGESQEKQEEKTKNTQQNSALHDAWLQGKLETVYILNKHLNPFDIDTEVKNGEAYLNGTVESEVHKDLAEELALSIKGINHVENKLLVDRKIAGKSEDKPGGERSFSQIVEDATTTASVKSKLLFGVDLEGNALKINVDTRNGVVTLQGDVDSSAVKDLAGNAAKNVSSVREVQNNLKVVEKS